MEYFYGLLDSVRHICIGGIDTESTLEKKLRVRERARERGWEGDEAYFLSVQSNRKVEMVLIFSA